MTNNKRIHLVGISSRVPQCPVLLVIGRYEIPQANAVKQIGNATFMIAPINEKELQDMIKEANKESSKGKMSCHTLQSKDVLVPSELGQFIIALL